MKARVKNVLRSKYKNVHDAEMAMGISHDASGAEGHLKSESSCTSEPDRVNTDPTQLQESTFEHLLLFCTGLDTDKLAKLGEAVFSELLNRQGVPSPGEDFIKLSVLAMETLSHNAKSNVVYKLAKIVACKRPGSDDSLIPLHRMPWGLLQYNIDFFACGHINQVIYYTVDELIMLCRCIIYLCFIEGVIYVVYKYSFEGNQSDTQGTKYINLC